MPEDNQIYDIAIVGGGDVGLAMTLALSGAAQGALKIVLLGSTAAARSDDPRAFALSAASRHLLESLDVWNDVSAQAQAVTRIEITDTVLDAEIRPVLLSYDNEVDGEPASTIMPGSVLTQALAQKLNELLSTTQGVAWHRDARVVAAHQGTHLTTLETSPLGTIKARLAIAADGARSTLREQAAIKTMTWSTDQLAIVARVRLSQPLQGLAVQHFLPGGPFAILPLPGDLACITWSEDKSRAVVILAMNEAGFAAEIGQRFGRRLGSIVAVEARASFPLDQHLARELVGPRLALIGDAARRVHPIAGQGLNLGLRDVAALAQCIIEAARLGQDIGAQTTLAAYARWRRFDQVTSQLAFDGLNRLFSNDNIALRAMRDLGLSLVERSPALKQSLVREAAGLSGDVPRLLRGLPI